MTSKKYKLLLGLLLLLSTGVYAQVSGRGSTYDSSVIPPSRMAQQNEFLNGQYAFPAKPRNMWEIGASAGMLTVSGDVSAKLPTFGFEAHVRKAFGYVFSLRLQYLNGVAKGLNWKGSQNFAKNPAWNAYAAPVRLNNGQIVNNQTNMPGATDIVYYNYKANIQDLSLQGIITLNNIRFHKDQSRFLLYGGVGIGGTLFQTKINALNGNTPYNFATINGGVYENRRETINAIEALLDDSYETEAQQATSSDKKFGNYYFKPSGTILAGLAFKLGKRVNLTLEDRFTIVKTDGLDGQMWQENPIGDAALTSENDSYNFLSLGLNVNLGSKTKNVEPLWWLNPLDYAYRELRVEGDPKDCLDDDGDGVCNHLDREPNTPAGCPVDTHGVTRDTDGDGVPDCKDKQLITPTECQPVNADGVGKCPDPKCCEDRQPPIKECPCDYPSLSFKGNVTSLSADNKAMLSSVASKLKAYPNCTISIVGYPQASKTSQAACQRRLDAIRMYLSENAGISADRIMTDCMIEGGETNTVDIKCN